MWLLKIELTQKEKLHVKLKITVVKGKLGKDLVDEYDESNS